MKVDYTDYDDDDPISLDELDPKQREKLIQIWSDKSEIKHYIG